ncbi:Fungal transcriptional regulatory protein, N-terminal [Penicillium digitatum]|uniref:Zn(2)-C6 fungal-type domain-containing protein n=3 Tax=Penicillium digitatum TaxID=36651 RepID=K9H2Y2_PEND2|nr:hypothetical protein PDIP_13890 [Penicillium digitatum Pd1]EKV19466.1 hypothetical protein PDIG_02630 [Penicillium digitatum PHI26]EKV20673.1 hypothetical protein PDIP_13890 [Penicillium digitatum Pd1]QQK44894.1 Fungal transcriptional regulatory protein, N-terminal [Penicillium digitatum]
MSPTEKQKDLSHRHRSFKGCWTCKKRRIQCDELRPTCQKCNDRGLTCEGYEIRLRWGTGIASRGKYSGAEKPVKESTPPRSKRRCDMRVKEDKYSLGDGNDQPDLVSQTATIKDQDRQSVAERATVNILNSPWEPGSPRSSAINRHFEIPASSATLPIPTMYDRGIDASGQYAQKAGRRSILA